jgi:hypothetical protein
VAYLRRRNYRFESTDALYRRLAAPGERRAGNLEEGR